MINQRFIQQMRSVKHHLWHTSTPTCFGTEEPSSGSHYNNCVVTYTSRYCTLRTAYLDEIFTEHMEQRLLFVYIIYMHRNN
jgi:hypothetical protein